MANILYRGAAVPSSTNTAGANDAPLTNVQIDKNLYALNTDKLDKVTPAAQTVTSDVTFSGNVTISGTTTTINTTLTGISAITSGTDNLGIGLYTPAITTATTNTGNIIIWTGDSTSGNSGEISIASGVATGAVGKIAGSVRINPGFSHSDATNSMLRLVGSQSNAKATTGIGGHVWLKGGDVSQNAANVSATGGNVYISGGSPYALVGARTGGSVYIDGGLPTYSVNGVQTYGDVNIGTRYTTGYATNNISIGQSANPTVIKLNGTVKLSDVGTSGFVKLGVGGQLSADTTTYATGSGTASGTNTGDQTIPTTLPASDVYAWAKAATKPSYALNEISSAALSATTGTFSGVTTISYENPVLIIKDTIASSALTNSTISFRDYLGAEKIGFTTLSSTLYLAFAGTSAYTITSSNFAASGNIVASGTITASSDARIKTNVAKIDNALSKVEQLNGYTFDRTDIETPRQTGVIAQEVLKVLPEAVMGSEDTTYSVAYGNMVGLMIEAIKELNAKVIDLQNQLNNK